MKFGKSQAKRQLRAGWYWSQLFLENRGFISADAVCLPDRSLISPGHSLFLCFRLFPLSEHQGHARREGAGFLPMGNLSPSRCGVKAADVAPLCANNIRKLGSFWLGCKMELFQEFALGALKQELLENKLDNKGQIVITFPPGKPWNSPSLFEHLRKRVWSSEQ